MSSPIPIAEHEIEQLRLQHYNAEVTEIKQVHEELVILRVRPDWGRLEFSSGQYSTLGLGYWEPRVADTQEEDLAEGQYERLVKRAYSISCPLLDGDGRLVRSAAGDLVEFYITLVRRAESRPPALTPRLFKLGKGDRLFLGPHVHGHYSLAPVRPGSDVIFVATGTGEAPHNAMLAELLFRGHRGRIVSIVCVRNRRDLGYLDAHRQLAADYACYHYIALTTREPENLDEAHPDFVGKRYVQGLFQADDFEHLTGCALDPTSTHVFLCGNPAMIGVPHHTHDPAKRYPKPLGMVEVLEKRGFHVDQPHEPGNIHFEKYW